MAQSLAFPTRYRGVAVDYTTLFRWVQSYAAKPEHRVRRHLRPCTGFWRVDETSIKVKGVWSCLYHVVDSLGQIIDLLLSARRIPVRQSASSPRRWLRRTA